MPSSTLMQRLLAAAVLLHSSSGRSAAVPPTDSQLWSELDATYTVSTDLTATGILTTRFGNGLPNPALTAAGLQIDYRIRPWTASVTGYYVSVRNAQSGVRTELWLPAAALTYEMDVGLVALSDRNRVEQLEGIPGSPIRYRNRVSADWHLPGEHRLTDFLLSDEVFYDFAKDRWRRNRAQAGVSVRLAERTRLQAFYLRQNNTDGVLARLNVLGLTVQIDIP